MTRLVGALAAVVVALGLTWALPGLAGADTVITADMNNDGIPDQVQLGQTGAPASPTCSVTVSYGKSGGGFRKPQSHTYPSSAATEHLCPNLAVAVKLGNETKPDLVTAASFGEFGVLILHNFQPAGFAPGVIQPTFMRTADLNGDGRQDILLWSAQVSQLTSLFNTAQGVLVRGPISVGTLASGGNNGAAGPQYVLADFNGDGGQDMLLSVNQEGPGLGHLAPIFAEVFFGNGQGPTVLAITSDVNAIWTVFSIDLDANGIPDAGIIETSGIGVTTVRYFHNDGVGNFTPVP